MEATLSTYAYPLIGALPVQSVDTSTAVHHPSIIIHIRQRVWGRIELVIDAAKARGEYVGENPGAGRVTSRTYFRSGPRCERCRTIPPCPIPSCQNS